MSFDPGAMFAALGGAAAAPATNAATPATYAGTWQMSDPSGRACTIDLKNTSVGGTYQAWSSMCSGELFGIQKWQLRGYDVVLLDLMGKPKATLRATQPNRLDGTVAASGERVSMWR
ncbi:AprI/Inh family metalloprotease inhibitor [Lutibaculum baratangense]|uniref:Alkaline proteinase inhibitor/ Outer membrane lipoprotein Omp19 domain-containing protein n=1 Tax=Lutibaculum baratangense AMV1 TaxID=631454 RepID=V4TCN5_9HYPH|nr:AprI/Inh family metalloprotease inhibitor [Lutibaculum baratangense]ESR24063.1 hypothetical protein N177_2512 [Lutibaculum baratangense AMV1]